MKRLNRSSSRPVTAFLSRAMRGEAALWQVWWLAGIPVVALAVWLGMTAEDFRYDEEHFWGALFDTTKFLLCLAWLVTAWRCSHNVRIRALRHIGRIAIGMAILFVGLIY
jgi:hypothetical protein